MSLVCALEVLFYFTLYFFSHLPDAFIQSDLQIRKSNKNDKLRLYKYYIYTFKKMDKLNKMTNAYNNISKLNNSMKTKNKAKNNSKY